MTTETARRYTITLPEHPPSPNGGGSWVRRWRVTHRLRDNVAWQAAAIVVREGLPSWLPFQRARVTCTLVYKRGPVRDVDNATASCKGAIDGLQGRLIVSDNPDCIVLEVRQMMGPRKETVIEVEEVTDDATVDLGV